MKNYWSQLAKQLTPYVAGEQPRDRKYVKLNTNENPYPPTSEVSRILSSFDTENLRKYSDPDNTRLRGAIAKHYGIQGKNIFIGNGSDEVLAMAFPAFCNTSATFADVTYSFYSVYCNLYRIKAQILPLQENFEIKIDDYLNNSSDMIVVCNPNAPTGIALSKIELEKIVMANSDKVVLVDEAYSAFMGYSAVNMIDRFPNLLVVKTFSKAYSLAGARCGYAIGDPSLIKALENIKNSFNSYTVNAMTEQLASVAIEDVDYENFTTGNVIATRERAVGILQAFGFSVLPSSANFLFVKHARVLAKDIYIKLKERGILVRYFNKPRIDNYLRITIGTDQEMAELYGALNSIVMV